MSSNNLSIPFSETVYLIHGYLAIETSFQTIYMTPKTSISNKIGDKVIVTALKQRFELL